MSTKADVAAGFALPCRPEEVVDVYFDDQRVFSVAPKGFTEEGGRFRIRWPRSLQPHLCGRTRLVVREHLTGTVLFDEPWQFGQSTERVRVQDRLGRPLAVDKFGALVRMFSGAEENTAKHLAAEVSRLVADVNAFGVHGFLAYGSLLGAVRNGRLIGHDTDADIAYLSNHRQPTDIALESFALERFLAARGWDMARMRVGLVRAVFRDAAGDLRHIDIFTATHDGSRLFLDRFVWTELPYSALVPLGSVTLEGVEIAAPADPHAVLAATYGPTYLVPDPSFRYHRPRALQRASLAWFGNYRQRRGQWHSRLRSVARHRLQQVPAFASWVAEQEPDAPTVVDVGSGTGVSALWFARSGRRVVGLDYADSAVGPPNRTAAREHLDAVFRRVSLYDVRGTLATGARLAAEERPVVMVARNLLDVLEPEGRTNFWLLARTALLGGGRLYLSFRTAPTKAARREPGFRPLDADRIESEARERGARVLLRDDRRRATTMVLAWGCP